MKTAVEEIRALLEKAAGEKIGPEDVGESPVADYGSSIAFRLAGKRRRSPVEIAEEIANAIKPSGIVKRVDSVNGYVNFHLDYEKFAAGVLTGKIKKGSGRGDVILEHTSVNPSGPIHVGRLRNTIIGDSLKRILEFYGHDVETRYYVNDVGKQIAIIALGHDGDADGKLESEYKRYSEKEDFRIFFRYVAANKKFEEDVKFQERVQDLIRMAENGDKKSIKKMTDAANRCLAGQKETFKRLGVEFDRYDYESDSLVDGSARKVIEGLKKNELWKSSDAGAGLDLGGFGIERRTGFTVLERPDGTTVYLSRDLAYHLKKGKDGKRLMNVLGEDHKMQFQELKAILENMLGFGNKLEAVHFSFVSFEGTKLSTRRGEIASVDELIDEAVEKAEGEIKKRDIATPDVAPAIGIGAIKYHIIKTSPNKQITFRWDEALSFDGESGPYLQYAHARCCSILDQAGKPNVKGANFELTDVEKELVRTMSQFGGEVERTALELKPSVIANYLYRLADVFSRFYKECPVLSAEKGVGERRILITEKMREILEIGLNLLGIEAPRRM